MCAALIDPASAVQLIPEAINLARFGRLLALWLVRLIFAARLRGEREIAAIRRPDRAARAVLHKGQLARLAPIRRNQPDLRLALALLFVLFGVFAARALAVRDEGQPFAIRRPARGAITFGTKGEAARIADLASGRHDPDRVAIFASVLIDGLLHIGDARPIRRNLRVADPLPAVEVFCGDSSAHTA